MYIAHSENSEGETHSLIQHITSVAELATRFAGKFGADELGHWIGVWHDVGKFHPDFQAYLLENPDRRGPDHKAAGALLALNHIERLSFPIAGHHGGLKASANLKSWLREKRGLQYVQEALELAQEAMNSIEPENPLPQPGKVRSKLDAEFFLRMLFSTLVDADFLDTEKHFDPGQSNRRSGYPSLTELWRRFEHDQENLTGRADDVVNSARHEIYKACLEKADESPGFFRLTAPTGGGKTRSGIAFGLRHALKHNLDRVIVAMPYTSIIDQTADEYRKIFGKDVIVEHHSAVAPPDPNEPSEADIRACLAGRTRIETQHGHEVIEDLAERIKGRVSAQQLLDPDKGEKLLEPGEMISVEKAQRIGDSSVERVNIRNILSCRTQRGVCAKCYGMDMATHAPVKLGAAVGLLAAQSVRYSAMMLTMRTFHSPTRISRRSGSEKEKPKGGLPRLRDLVEGKHERQAEQILCEMTKIFREQGVAINDKHFEVIAAQIIKNTSDQGLIRRAIAGDAISVFTRAALAGETDSLDGMVECHVFGKLMPGVIEA